MQTEPMRSKGNSGSNSYGSPIRKHPAWLALLALILGVVIGNSATRQNVPALTVFAIAIVAAALLASKEQKFSLPVFCIGVVILIALINPKLLAFFGSEGPSGFSWTTLGACAGFGLLGASFAVSGRTNRMVTGPANAGTFSAKRTVTSYDLVLTTVSKIPAFVKRLHPFSGNPLAEKRVNAPANPADFICRGLPTPPEPVRRWPARELPPTK